MTDKLKDRIKRFAKKSANIGRITLASLAIVYSATVCSALLRVYAKIEHQYNISYISDPSKNDVLGDLINNHLVWESIQPNPEEYSTLELMKRNNILVNNSVNYDENILFPREVGPLTDSESPNIDSVLCSEYAYLTYAGFIDLTEKHPELRHHLENVRIASGNTSDGRTEASHGWLEVRIDGEWRSYETTIDRIDETYEIKNLAYLSELQPDFWDELEYYRWVSFQVRQNGSVEKDINYVNIFLHKEDLTKRALVELEEYFDKKLLDRPYTNLMNDLVSLSPIFYFIFTHPISLGKEKILSLKDKN